MRSTLVTVLLAAACSASGYGGDESTASPRTGDERLEIPPPPFSDGIFPCTSCHADLKVNRTRRALTEMHDDIQLRHDEQHRWCLDCHDATDRDWLHLASGERILFEQSYLLCAHCHNPHQPRFRSLAPKPAPHRPQRPKEETGGLP